MMYRKLTLAAWFITSAFAAAYGQSAVTAKVPWKLTVVILDGIDRSEKADIPVKEAVAFIEANSRFVFEVEYVVSPAKHGYTPYRMPDRKFSYAMLGWNLPDRLVRSLPVSSSYLFLYKINGRRPAAAGSALGLDFGLIKGRKARPYATAPTDMHWYINEPNQGFKSWAAQILTHEIVNTIQAKVEARPYRCGQLTGTPGVSGNIHERERLASMTDKCYKRLGNNA
ncbi:MAG: hypothetical protein ABIV21_04685, partial [Pyrinomonadaceae bacterium]